MEAAESLLIFIKRLLVPEKVSRYAKLISTSKGQQKFLQALDHDFEKAMRSSIRQSRVDPTKPCFAHHAIIGFAVAFDSVESALRELAQYDSWLIVLADGSGGIYQPETYRDRRIEVGG